jgi:hypothetical protein
MAIDAVPNGANGAKQSTNSELDKIRRNSLYMTFNAPQVDDYVCNLILILAPLRKIPHFVNSGVQVFVSEESHIFEGEKNSFNIIQFKLSGFSLMLTHFSTVVCS